MAREGGAAASRLAAIDTGIATRQVKHLISDPAQGTRNRGETRARHQAPLRQLQREILRAQQGSDRLPEMSHRHAAHGGERAAAPQAAAAPAREEEVVAPENAEAGFVSLEEADAESKGKRAPEGEADEC